MGSAIGRLEIPRIGLSVVVLEGSDSDTLRLGVGRLQNSSLPGEPGNVVLAGHRDTFFRALRTIRQGDQIAVRTEYGTFPYKVDWTRVVNPTDVEVLQPTPQPSLTLVTCYPFYYVGAAPQRFIVRAVPASAAVINATAPSPKPSPMAVPAPPARVTRASRTKAEPKTQTADENPDDSALRTVIDGSRSSPSAPAAASPGVAVAAADPASTVGTPDDPPNTPAQPATPAARHGLKRIFHKVAGVFSSKRDKLQ